MTRRILCALLLAVVMTAGTARADYQDELEAELAAVKELVDAGVADDIIVKHVRASGFVFDLTADDILELRRAGVSDEVIEAMIDTALDNTAPRERREAQPVDDSNVYVNLSAGWFSPWYYYPYAWGFYYDPFPAYYSYYYYPFRSAYYWGYYGYCGSYYYRSWCAPYRYWDDPRWYGTGFHTGCSVPAPHNPAVPAGETWQGAGLRNNRGRPGNNVTPPAVSDRREATVVRRSLRDRLHAARVRTPDGARTPREVSAADAPRRRNGSSVESPRRQRLGTAMERRRPAQVPNGRREARAAPAPRTETPQTAPRTGSAPQTAPRTGSAPRSAPAPRSVGAQMGPRSGAASAPRGGGVSSAPRGSVGARGRMR